MSRGHQYAPFTVGTCQNFLVARVRGPFASPHDVMACRFEFLARPSPHTQASEEASYLGFHQEWFDSFMADQPVSVDQTNLYILWFQPGLAFEDRLNRVASS